MLDVNDLVEGVTKVRILELPQYVNRDVGDVGVFQQDDEDVKLPLEVEFEGQCWYFDPDQLEIVKDLVENDKQTKSEDLIIYKSRWDELVESLEGVAGMTDEEAEVVKSVLKNNVPFCVVELSDLIIEKEEQTHLDTTHIGDTGNASLYYKSEILKKWFWWGEDYKWVECDFNYEDWEDLFPITISK